MLPTIYEKLQAFLDSLPIGYPTTKSGVDIEILKKIFQPEEAEMAVHLQPFPEAIDAFCQRTGFELKKAQDLLEKMANKGQIFRMRNEGKVYYSAAVFLPGMWEYQLNRLDQPLAEMVERY